MDDNHVLSTWNDLCAKVPEEKLQKVMGAGKGNSWADSICWSIRAWRYWDIRNSSQHYRKTSETAMGCTSAAFTYQKYMKTSHSWAEVNESSKISVFPSQGWQRSWRLAAVHQGGWSGIGGLLRKFQVTRHDDMMRREIHKFKQKKDSESVVDS